MILLLSCGLWWKALVSRVELPVYVHKFGRSLELESWETHTIKHTFVNQQWPECSSNSFFFSLFSYSLEFTHRFTETHLVSFHFFEQWRRRKSKLPYSCKFVSDFFFVSIYFANLLSSKIEHRKMLPCYCPVFLNFYLCYTKTKYYLLLVIKGFPLRLIVHAINTSFHTHFNFWIYWKKIYNHSSDLL